MNPPLSVRPECSQLLSFQIPVSEVPVNGVPVRPGTPRPLSELSELSELYSSHAYVFWQMHKCENTIFTGKSSTKLINLSSSNEDKSKQFLTKTNLHKDTENEKPLPCNSLARSKRKKSDSIQALKYAGYCEMKKKIRLII